MGLLTSSGPLASQVVESAVAVAAAVTCPQSVITKSTFNSMPTSVEHHLSNVKTNNQLTNNSASATQEHQQQEPSPPLSSTSSSWSGSPENSSSNNNNNQTDRSLANQQTNSDSNRGDNNNFLYLHHRQQQDASAHSQCLTNKRQSSIPHQNQHQNQHHQQHLQQQSDNHNFLQQQQHEENSLHHLHNQHHQQLNQTQLHYQKSPVYFDFCQSCGHQTISCRCRDAQSKMILDKATSLQCASDHQSGSLSTQQGVYSQGKPSTSPPVCRNDSLVARYETSEYHLSSLDSSQMSNKYNQHIIENQRNHQIQAQQNVSAEYIQVNNINHQLLSHKQQQQQQQQQSSTLNQHDQQLQQSHQQVSSQTDQQLMISGNSNGDLMVGANQLAYNYDEQSDLCADNWNMVLDHQQTDNCSSQNMQNGTILGDSPFQENGISMNEAQVFTTEQHIAHQQQQQQAYQQSVNSNMSKVAPKSSNDLNNNQQQRHEQQHRQQERQTDQQSSSLSTLAPLQTGGPLEQSRDSSFCNQQQDQYYYNNPICNGSSSTYRNQTNSTEYRYSDGYDQNQAPYGQAVFTYELLEHNHPQAHSPDANLVLIPNHLDQQQQSPTSSSMQHIQLNRSYQQTTSIQQQHLQNETYEKQNNLIKHNRQTNGSASQSNYQNYCQPDLQLPTYPITQANLEQEMYSRSHPNQIFEHYNDAPVADLYSIKSNSYNNQQAINRDNYVNQVSTTTNPSVSTNDGSNKMRSLKGRRGRPRKKGLRSKNKVNGKLWEFIRDLLLSDRTNPSFIRWERREDGVFKFVQSDKVAKMWGERKQNPKMTYEKLSRAMRYYYKSKVLLPVFGRRLVYKFGPNATGWLPETETTLFS